MFYITGDTHGRFDRIEEFCERMMTTTDDTMIILGDAGLNYWRDKRDARLKKRVSQLPITLFCIHGNHEERPQNIGTYSEGTFHGGGVLYEEAYPNLLFAIDGEVYNFDDKQCLVIGGAYSVDKFYRLATGSNWFPSEQPTPEIKGAVEKKIAELGNKVAIVLTHTSPAKYEPTEVFLSGVDQSTVDKSTELWLDTIEEMLAYQKWYCGHYHTSKKIDKLQFMFNDFDLLSIEPEGRERKDLHEN